MESIFVGETPMDPNHWGKIECDYDKLKIGEIFQLSDRSLSMTCTNCWQEFQYFTEFSLHIQDHYFHGEIAQLQEIKEEEPVEVQPDPSAAAVDEHEDDVQFLPDVECELVENSVFGNSDFDTGWSDDDFGHTIFESQPNIQASEDAQRQMQFTDGTEYEKVNNRFRCLTCDHETDKWKHFKEHLQTHLSPKEVACPVCSKLFASVSYVRKHCSRTHNMRIGANKIKEAQTMNKPITVDLLTKPKEVKKVYDEGVDYQKVDDKFQCLTCDKKMAKLDHLKEHLLTHTTEKNVYCPFCARAFITESYVRKHVNRTHKMRITAEEIKSAQSSIDVSQVKKEWAIKKDKSASKAQKSNSTATDVLGTIICFFCPKKFTKARYAQKHMRLIHAKPMTISEVIESQPKRCSVKLESLNLGDPRRSSGEVIKIKTQPKDISVTTAVKKPMPVKRFECFDCHKKFVGLTSIRIHMKLHSGIKWSCPFCYKPFAMRSYVRDHIVIMHGIKRENIPNESIRQARGDFTNEFRPQIDSYECFLCKNEYKKRNRLREHMQSHISGPYLCVNCGTVCKTMDTLR